MERNIALDVLKLVMAFMVLGVHADFLSDVTALGEYLTVNGIFRIAVPVFLVVNGFYFFSALIKGEQVDWLKRVFILYFVWMLFYAFFWFSVPKLSWVGMLELAKTIVIGYRHLWYLTGMMGAAMMLLIMRRLSSSRLMTASLLFFVVGVFVQYTGNYSYFGGGLLDDIFNMHWVHRNFLFFSFPFFCIGYLINKHAIHDKFTLRQAILLSAVGVSLLLSEAYANYVQNQREGGFDNYLSLLVAGPSLFILFIKIKISGNGKGIALYSSAIYFIHPFFLSIFRKTTDLEASELTVLVAIVSVCSSYFILKINNRVKFIL